MRKARIVQPLEPLDGGRMRSCNVASRELRGSHESIDITISGPGFSFDLDAFQTGIPTSQNYGTVDTTSLNSLLATDGSAYQFCRLAEAATGLARLRAEPCN